MLDKEEAQRFLRIIHAESNLIEIRAFGNNLPARTAWFKPSQEAEILSWLEKYSDRNLSHGVASRKDETGAVDFTNWIWADHDNPAGVNPKILIQQIFLGFPFPPTLIVKSSPHKGKLHLYWRLREPCDDPERFKEVSRALSKAIGGDKTINVKWVLRIPGTRNYKYDDPTIIAKLAKYVPEVRISLDEIEKLLGLSNRIKSIIATGDSSQHDSRSERDFSVFLALASEGISTETVKVIFNHLPVGDKHRERGNDTYFDFSWDKAKKELGVQEGESIPTPVAGLVLKGNAIWAVDSEGLPSRPLMNGWFDPNRILVTDNGEIIEGTLYTPTREVPLAIDRKAFVDGQSLRKAIPVFDINWIGNTKQTWAFLQWVNARAREKAKEKEIRVKATSTIGFHGALFVAPNGAFDAKGPVEDPKIVYYDAGRVHPPIEIVAPTNQNQVKATLELLAKNLMIVNKPEITWPMLAWYLSAMAKPFLGDRGFPILGVFGTQGSGKTSTIRHIFQRIVGYKNYWGQDAKTTSYVLKVVVGSTNCIPVHLAELRSDTLGSKGMSAIIRLLQLAYDASSDSRGRPDQTTIEYNLTAPIAVDGEEPINLVDASINERTYPLGFKPDNISSLESREAFYALRSADLNILAYPIIQTVLGMQYPEMEKAALEVIKQLGNRTPFRIARNIAFLQFGFEIARTLAERYKVELPEDFMGMDVIASHVDNSVNPAGRVTLAVDEFVEFVLNAVLLGDADFVYTHDKKSNVLFFHLATAYNAYAQWKARQHQTPFTKAALVRQLKERMGDIPSPDKYVVCANVTKTIDGSPVRVYGIAVDQAAEIMDVASELSTFTVRI